MHSSYYSIQSVIERQCVGVAVQYWVLNAGTAAHGGCVAGRECGQEADISPAGGHPCQANAHGDGRHIPQV